MHDRLANDTVTKWLLRSDPAIHPKDWKPASASLKKKYTSHTFLEILILLRNTPQRKFCIVKEAVNPLKAFHKRREAILVLRDEVIRQLTIVGRNPILSKVVEPIQMEGDIFPNIPFIGL